MQRKQAALAKADACYREWYNKSEEKRVQQKQRLCKQMKEKVSTSCCIPTDLVFMSIAACDSKINCKPLGKFMVILGTVPFVP